MQPDGPTGPTPWKKIFIESWASVLGSVLLITYGILSAIQTALSPTFRDSPGGALFYIVFSLAFVFIGMAAMIGLRTNSVGLRNVVTTVFVVSMLCFGLLILIFTKSPFGLLMLGFALTAFQSGRVARREERRRALVLRLQAEDRAQGTGSFGAHVATA